MIKIEAVVLVLINCILLVCGQVLWKIGLKNVNYNGFGDLINIIFNKYILGGIIIYGLATFYWLYVLKKYDLSKVYPLQAMSYILVVISGFFILKEPISKNTIIGTLIICIGVFVITKK